MCIGWYFSLGKHDLFICRYWHSWAFKIFLKIVTLVCPFVTCEVFLFSALCRSDDSSPIKLIFFTVFIYMYLVLLNHWLMLDGLRLTYKLNPITWCICMFQVGRGLAFRCCLLLLSVVGLLYLVCFNFSLVESFYI